MKDETGFVTLYVSVPVYAEIVSWLQYNTCGLLSDGYVYNDRDGVLRRKERNVRIWDDGMGLVQFIVGLDDPVEKATFVLRWAVI